MNDLLKKPVPKYLGFLMAAAAIGIVAFLAAPLVAEIIEDTLHPVGRDCCSPEFPVTEPSTKVPGSSIDPLITKI